MDEEITAWRNRPLVKEYPYLIADALYEKIRIQKKSLKLTEEQKKVYDFIGFKPTGIEEIVIHTGMSTGKVLQIISELQFNNLMIEKNLNEFIRI